MTEIIIIFLFLFGILDGKLQLTLYFTEKHVIEKNIIVFLI
jgi:hypothetical protein